MTPAAVLAEIGRHPIRTLVWHWNWKSAVCSATSRGLVFCAVNLSVGPEAGLRALATEFCLRFATAGFYGAITQALSTSRPAWAGSLAALVVLPLVAHTVEFLVHTTAGTSRVRDGIAASVLFTVVTTAFNTFAMRRGLLTVGLGSRSFWGDLHALPRAVVEFAGALPRAIGRLRRTGEA
jgi:hypothetical protein